MAAPHRTAASPQRKMVKTVRFALPPSSPDTTDFEVISKQDEGYQYSAPMASAEDQDREYTSQKQAYQQQPYKSYHSEGETSPKKATRLPVAVAATSTSGAYSGLGFYLDTKRMAGKSNQFT